MRILSKLLLGLALLICFNGFSQSSTKHGLHFSSLSSSWDEAIPLGNGLVGALVWQKGDQLRFSLDRADLWDMRPMKGIHRKEFSFKWVQEHVAKKDYGIVQQYFDAPYESEPAPSKIPGGALEFNTGNWGKVESVNLTVENALCVVKWANGALLKTFVHATKPIGWFKFENIDTDHFTPSLIVPKYEGLLDKNAGGSVGGDDLTRLGYKQGTVKRDGNSITYDQYGWGGFHYQISVSWKKVDKKSIEGTWSISSIYPSIRPMEAASKVVNECVKNSFASQYESHLQWWRSYWNKSSITIPDTLLEHQYYMEMYKFGSAARRGAPPISLQAVWTADNGRLPPWKGDFHHDLNTQLSYWPSYTGNHLEEAMGYLDHFDQNKKNYQRYTKQYFDNDGLNVPGVTTLDGTEMGGWIQYSLSPTVGSWIAQHYYLQWRYSMDRVFLKDRAYPWIKEVAHHLESVTVIDENGKRKLPISASPEINDNSLKAWFPQTTNYDLALMKYTFKIAAELAGELKMYKEAEHWANILNEFPGFALSENSELMFAPSMAYNQSHRHFSHQMAIHPLGLIRWEDGPEAQKIIKNTIQLLDKIGPSQWCGYSYSWLGNIKARAKDGEGAANDLQIFAKAFCLKNSFHVNGDQTASGFSSMTYRPFTLEGNFAFASGIQEMLIQSYSGNIVLFPAVPASWHDIQFTTLRTEGAFLVSATMKDKHVVTVTVQSEQGGVAQVLNPFEGKDFKIIYYSSLDKKINETNGKVSKTNTIILDLKKNEKACLQIR
jgi:alpha-L-fucosidase 2